MLPVGLIFCEPMERPTDQGGTVLLFNSFVVDNTACFRNEMLMCNTLLECSPTFDR